jgi:hypothetical protein
MLRTAGRMLFVVAFVGLAVADYELLGAGPTPSEKAHAAAWWRPAGLLHEMEWGPITPLREIADAVVQARHEGRFEPRGLVPLALFCLPALAMTAAGFVLFRSELWRTAFLALGLTLSAFSYYGWLDLETWQDYSWRWPAVLLCTAAYAAVFARGPALVRAAGGRPVALRVLAAVGLVVSIYFLSIEVTGTNPTLQWNLSPWPALTLYGFLLVGLVLGVVHLSAGIGRLTRGASAGPGGIVLSAALAAAVAVLLRGIPFATTGWVQVCVLALPAAVLAATAAPRAPRRDAALPFLVAGLLILGSVKIGQWQGEFFQAESRDEIAPRVVAAIERYRTEHGSYPEELTDLVPAYLAAIPLPRIGWFDSSDETFLYTDLGDSFLLEFPSVLWVQCAYSPAYAEEDEDEDEGAKTAGAAGAEKADESEHLEAAWSCERKPPRLW